MPEFGDPGYVYDPMDPLPGQKYVEYSKDGEDGETKIKDVDSGLKFEIKGKYIFLKEVKHPAPTHNLHPGDRVIAVNGKTVEKYKKDLTKIKTAVDDHNVVRLVVDPTTLRK